MTFIYCSQILLFHYHHLHKTGIFHIKSADIFHLLGKFSENQHLDVSQRLLILDQLIVESAESTDYMNSM